MESHVPRTIIFLVHAHPWQLLACVLLFDGFLQELFDLEEASLGLRNVPVLLKNVCVGFFKISFFTFGELKIRGDA